MTTTLKKLLVAMSLTLLAAGAHAQGARLKKGDKIPDQYIVVLKQTGLLGGLLSTKEISRIGEELARQHGGRLLYIYGNAINGYLVRMTAAQAAALAKDPAVKYLEQDSIVTLGRSQSGPTWGLDRVDQRKPSLDSRYNFPESAGDDVNIYVIDTGVRGSHAEFKDRIGGGANFAAAGPGPGQPGLLDSALELFNPNKTKTSDWDDCNGHGTHVAGTAAGERYGVAKRATVYAVRVLGCDGSGTNSGVIAGVEWVAKNGRKPAVANLSLGGGSSKALDDALRKLVSEGVIAVVAAGNENQDACGGSPSRVPEAITVGATDKKDQRASFSNWGKCVDLSAPGVEITSAWFDGDSHGKTISGTSMAAPHVAGAVALYLAERREARPSEIVKALMADSSRDAIAGPKGSPNRLLYTGRVEDSRREPASQRQSAPQQQQSPIPPLPRLPLGR